MDVLTTEEQQVEALKKWWKENWASIIGGVLIGASIIVGWQLWTGHQVSQAKVASSTYEAMMSAMQSGQVDVGLEFANNLVSQYPDSPYASLAALASAKMKLEQGDSESARTHLRWVMENGKPDEIRHTARLRLTQILLSEAKYDDALSLVADVTGGAFQSSYDAIKGDIYLAQGKKDQALATYQQALSNLDPASRMRDILQMKIDNLGGAAATVQIDQ